MAANANITVVRETLARLGFPRPPTLPPLPWREDELASDAEKSRGDSGAQ
jgi:hypothetical protein